MKGRLVFIIFIVLLASSCVSAKAGIVYDESIPLERTAWLLTGNAGTIIGYNGAQVNWTVKRDAIQIPAGDTLLEFNIDSESAYMHFTGKNILFRYTFEPQKQYILVAGYDPYPAAGQTAEMGFKIYVYEFGKVISVISAKDYLGFAPFLNVDEQQRRVLN
jgi:hypothetical protein